MAIDKSLLSGSTSLLLLKLLSEQDMYGYQMVQELRERSDHTFDFKAGTLYPILHALEQKGYVEARDEAVETGRAKRWYHLTDAGRAQLAAKETEWRAFSGAVTKVLEGGVCLA